ncbi:hypothetical protein P5P86_13690 [Nocardioides sp. BP30]|uniref:hypothetical protein n=1 Tax=Nocardioides sp. BP30 TaxID=3036374 RepID=UPI0024687AF5|nr:hypothetical protein [Nocardioides sp. BP30]WGL51014.1 hypothetical protein P5P86_13690 [Nocardioides sp. BP30]
MRFELDPAAGEPGAETGAETGADIAAAVQQAIDATATAYTDDARIDVEERLRGELRERGLKASDEAAIEELARDVRSGHHVSVL